MHLFRFEEGKGIEIFVVMVTHCENTKEVRTHKHTQEKPPVPK